MEIVEQFKSLFEPELVKALDKNARLVEVKAGETILEIGQTVRTMPIILSGTVKVSRISACNSSQAKYRLLRKRMFKC